VGNERKGERNIDIWLQILWKNCSVGIFDFWVFRRMKKKRRDEKEKQRRFWSMFRVQLGDH
jgi:hypothetical protein